MKYQKGQKLYKNNRKTGELDEITIIDVLYKFDKPVKSTYNYNEEALDSLINTGYLSDNVDLVKLEAIKKIEQQFNIKLKEV